MNQTHLHLLINHLPVVGSILGALVLGYGMWKKSDQTIIAGYGVLILSAIGGVIAFLTGEAAEESVEDLQGVSENMIEVHEEFATFALIALIVLGAFAMIGVVTSIKKSSLAMKVAWAVFIISLISFGFMARTGYTGGQIRHTELNPSAAQNTLPDEEQEANH